jgi:glycosyltransferase involved in cell wall biosynthesis
MIVVDDNVRCIGGHFFELSSLLMAGAKKLGYEPILAAHETFDLAQARSPFPIVPIFQTRRLLRWSMGVDGESTVTRSLSGMPADESPWNRGLQFFRDLWVPPSKRPSRMLVTWRNNFLSFIDQVKPTSKDRLLISTGDDFLILALASALQQVTLPSLHIDVVVHFALTSDDQPDKEERLRRIGRQTREAIDSMTPHHVHLHATTNSLAQQWRQSNVGTPVSVIPYPTRTRPLIDRQSSADSKSGFDRPLKLVLAGLPRAEKGRESIHDFLLDVQSTHLKNHNYQVSMQMPTQKWESMIPMALHDFYRKALNGSAHSPLEVMTSDLSTDDYHHWLDTADIGLFLYEPHRYKARCSGVLLELLGRGVPVIVPDNCWLAEQVRKAGGHRSIGFIYQDRSEIPELMSQFKKHRSAMMERAADYAKKLQQQHNAVNTLRVMGTEPIHNLNHSDRNAA